MARTLNINITDISIRPYGLTSPLSLEFPAFSMFDSRSEFAVFNGMTHLAVAVRVSNLMANGGSMRKVRHTFWVNVVDRSSDTVIASRTMYVEMQPWEEETMVRVDVPLRMSQIIENRFYYVNVTAPSTGDSTPVIQKDFRMVRLGGLTPAGFFSPEWGALMKEPFSGQMVCQDLKRYEDERYIILPIPEDEIDLFGTVVERPVYASLMLKKNYSAAYPDPEIIVRIIGDSGERYEERATVYDYDYLGNNIIAPDELLVQVPVRRSMELGTYFYVELLALGCPVAGAMFDVSTLEEVCKGELSGDDLRPIHGYDDLKGMHVINGRRYELELKRNAGDGQEEEVAAVAGTRLDSLIGLDGVKEKVAAYRSLVEFNRRRELLGLPTSGVPLHCMFLGSPGTGKTTVAKILGEILHDCGVLSKGHVVVHERATLIGQYYSSEGENIRKALEEARGGILFIDEAYQLCQPSDPKDPGRFVLESLMTALADEDDRDWMLILAGYTAPMMQLFKLNPGLRSRIPDTNFYMFDDFTRPQLMDIAERYLAQRKFELTDEAREALAARLDGDYESRGQDFGNARHVVNLIETGIFPAMARRLSRVKAPTARELSVIEATDIPATSPVITLPSTPRPGFRMRG